MIVLDEAYDEYLRDEDKSIAFSWLAEYKNLLVSRSFSKAHGLAGLRIGYGVGSKEVINLMNRVRQPFNVNSIAQTAAIASLDDDDFIIKSRLINDQGRLQLEEVFNELKIEYIPAYGNFISFNLGDETKAMMYYQHLLKNGVIVRPIQNYEMPSWLRVSIGLKEENNTFIKYLKSLRNRIIMIIVMNNSATDEEINFVVSRIKEKGLDASISKGTEKTVIGAVGDERLLDPKLLDNLPGVEQALRIVKPYKIVAREWHPEDTVIDINGHPIGGKNIQVISGPCSVETPDQMKNAAEGVKARGLRL